MPITKAQCAIITRAYADMPEVQHSFTNCRDMLKEICTSEERGHRRRHSDVWTHPLVTVRLAAEYFAVLRMAEEVLRPKIQVKDFLSVKESAFYAAAVVANARGTPKGDQLLAWAKAIPEAFWKMQYTEMVKP